MDKDTTQLPLAQSTGCGCCSSTPTPRPSITQDTRDTQVFAVTGLTCGHCAGAVSSELKDLPGVTGVVVDLVPGGTSTVSVVSDTPLARADVAAALDEAGNYRLTT